MHTNPNPSNVIGTAVSDVLPGESRAQTLARRIATNPNFHPAGGTYTDERGRTVPHGYKYDENGQLVGDDTFATRFANSPWPWILMMAPGAIGAAAAMAGGGSVAGGASAAGAGAGTTGSTVPVTGSLMGLAPSGAVPSAMAGGGSVLSGAGGAWTAERIAKLALGLGVPVAQLTTLLRAANPGGDANGVPGPFGPQINDALGMMNDRMRSTIPVHDAAMKMALAMSKTNPDPQLLNTAAETVRQPAPTLTSSPAVSQAAAEFMKRFGG